MRSINDKEILDVMWDMFPFKQSGYREYQKEVTLKIVKAFLNEKKFFILDAATGLGKSCVAYTAIKTIHYFDNGYRINSEGDSKPIFNGPYGLITMHSRSLQNQYIQTFPDATNIWSANNFPCAIDPLSNTHYGSGDCPKKKCTKYNICEYPQALGEFMEAKVGITNYAYYLHAPFVKPFVSVIDEAHNLEDVLCDWSKVEFSTKYLTYLLVQLVGLSLCETKRADNIQSLIRRIIFLNDSKDGWLSELRLIVSETITEILPLYKRVEDDLEEKQDALSDPKNLTKEQRENLQLLERSYKYFRNMMQKMNPIKTLETSWVISNRTEEENSNGKPYPCVDIKPLYIKEIAQTRLFRHSHFFLFMSATICSPSIFMKYLGINNKDTMFMQIPSTFDADKRQVYAIKNLGKFIFKNRESIRSEFTYWIDYIIEKQFSDMRGIIHSVSYENSKHIQENSKHANRMIFPDSDDLLEIVPLLKSKPNTIVVSPSVVEGLDLPGDLCRFCIFMKVPYASLGDKWVKARSDDDGTWYNRAAVIKIVQGSGRGTRSEDDYSLTVILDQKFLDVWDNHKNIFPKWYADAVNFITIPKD